MTIILVLAIALGVLGGCSSSKLVDGVYKAEFDSFDGHGYKAQLELTVADGKITDARFDEVAEDGKLKSQDEKYKTDMEEQSGMYPQKAYEELKQRLLAKQAADVDTVTGATASTKSFNKLVKYVIDEMAKKGDTTPAKVSASK